MAIIFIQWFYTTAPKQFVNYISSLVHALMNYFSVGFLFETLFKPFRHDVISLQRLPLHYWGHAIVSNLASRGIGIAVRGSVIFTGLWVVFLITFGALIALAVWYLLPILFIASFAQGILLIIRGLYGF